MTIDRRTLVAGAIGLTAAAPTLAQAAALAPTPATWPPAELFRLWIGRPPNSPRTLPKASMGLNGEPPRRELWLTGVADPVVGVYRPAKPDGRALLAIPGGGYEFVSVENEGINVARAFNPLGVTVFVLGYRLPGQGWSEPQDVPLQDGQRAMRLIRASAARYGIDPARLGCIGFSAGALLAASLATAWYDPVYAPRDDADKLDARPAYAGLIYPVTSGDLMRVGTGPAARFDPNRRVGRDTPPLFIAHALDDPVVPFDEPMRMLTAARTAGAPVEAHFFAEGGHGFGPLYLGPDLPGSRWPELFDRWTRRVAVKPPTRPA